MLDVGTPPNPETASIDLTVGDPLAGLTRWVAEGRVDAAAAQRAKQRWLERQAGEEATVAGVLYDLAERGRPVSITTRAGRRVRGPVIAVGADFAILRGVSSGDVVVPFGALALVRPAPGDLAATGDRMGSMELVFAEALSELAAECPRVLASAGGDEIRGELRSVGFDVAAILLDGTRRETAHVAIAALDHLIVLH